MALPPQHPLTQHVVPWPWTLALAACLHTPAKHACTASNSLQRYTHKPDSTPHVAPRALVLWLLLTPRQLGVRILPQHAQHHIVREWRNLLETHEHDVRDAAGAPRAAQVVVNLPGAQDDALNLGRRLQEGAAGLVMREVARVVRALAVIDQAVEEGAGRHVLQR